MGNKVITCYLLRYAWDKIYQKYKWHVAYSHYSISRKHYITTIALLRIWFLALCTKIALRFWSEGFNKLPSFTVKEPCAQLVKIDRVISVYLSLTGKTVWLEIITFVSWFNHGRVFIKFKPLNIWIKWFLLSFYSSEGCHLSEYKLKLCTLAGFLAHVKKFSRLLNKFEVWVSCEELSDIFIGFSVCFFKTEFNPLSNYWILDLKSLRLVSFIAAKTWKRKYADSRLFLENMASMFIVEDDVWKHFKYWPSSSNLH